MFKIYEGISMLQSISMCGKAHPERESPRLREILNEG